MTDFGTAELHPGLNLPLVSWDCELAIILYERGALGFGCFFLLFMIGIVQATLYLLRNRGNLDPTMTWVLASLLILFFMNANVAMFAPQLTFITSFVFAIESKLLATAGFRQQSAQPAEVVYAA